MIKDDKKKTHIIVTGKGGGGSGEQIQVDWNQTDDTQVDYIKNKPTIPDAQVQSDWNESDDTQPDYIKNKPTVFTQWFGTQAEYDLIDPKDPNTIYNIEGSDNVQADWNESDNTQPDYIKNKPTIPAEQVNADWNESDSSSKAYIANKPTIPAAPVQSDWNESNSSSLAYIQNKPTIPSVPAMATETLTFTLQGGTVRTIDFYTVPNYFYVEDISGSDNTLLIAKDNNIAPTIEVFKSTDRTNWESMGNTSTTAITATIPANSKLYLKASTNVWGRPYGGGANNISGNKAFNIGGNIMSLIYGDEFNGKTTLPEGCTLVNLFRMPNTSYWNKLLNAKDLVLPATTLTNRCYYGMFNNCTALTTTPELPATTLAGYCYQTMFKGCTSLTTAPALPATTLADGCYYEMFDGCTSLTTAPALPATTLANGCYESMFDGCQSLTTAPALPATTLSKDCYYEMFSGCSNLNNITTYANNISASNCLSYWLNNVSATGDFYNLGSATYQSGASGIPSGWTEHTSL